MCAGGDEGFGIDFGYRAVMRYTEILSLPPGSIRLSEGREGGREGGSGR